MKGRIAILERAYDKAAKLKPGESGKFAELEIKVLMDAIRWSKKLAEPERIARRDYIWKLMRWDTPGAEEQWQRKREEIINGRSRTTST